jgi:oligopeptide/dipeptide ABC transporter ATP-binding protein
MVIKQPQHPYTRLLVDSIPIADPGKRWGKAGDILATDDENDVLTNGCKFVGRCQYAMPICSTNPVPAYRTDPRRAVACYLYENTPVMSPLEVPQMLVQNAVSNRNGAQ